MCGSVIIVVVDNSTLTSQGVWFGVVYKVWEIDV